MAGRQPDADLSAEGMADQHHAALNAIEDVLLHEIGVVHRVPVLRRQRRLAETRQVDQVNAVGVLKERGDAAQALAVSAPSMQKQQVMRRRLSTGFVDEAGSAVLEALDADESTSQGEGRSVSLTSHELLRLEHLRRSPARVGRPSASSVADRSA